jgi:glycosyltransferase involved in cell wall biosynthesis
MIAASRTPTAGESDPPLPVRGILMITGRADFGGGPEHVYQLARAVSRSNPVFIASPREEPYWSRYQALVGPERLVEIPHRRFSPAALGRIVRFIRAQGIDIVHAHGRAAGIFGRPAALLAGVRCFYTPHGGTPVTSVRTACYAAVDYLLSAFTHGIIAVSGTEAQALESLCALRSRLEVIPNGVEIPANIESPATRLGGPLRVVHVTRFVFQKNSGLLLDVISSLRDMGRLDSFEFLLLGDGPGRAEFEAAAASRGLGHCVKLLGAVSNPGPLLGSAFCFVSTSRWEGLPLALLEAMARGVPVIASDVPGNQDAVTDQETGFLYDLAAPRDAARRLVQLAEHPVLWKQMVRAARHRAEAEFSLEAMADATLRLYTRSNRPGMKARPPRTSAVRPPAASLPVPGMAGALHSSR